MKQEWVCKEQLEVLSAGSPDQTLLNEDQNDYYIVYYSVSLLIKAFIVSGSAEWGVSELCKQVRHTLTSLNLLFFIDPVLQEYF